MHTSNYVSRLDWETFTIVQVLNPLVYHHEHFNSVVCLERTFIIQDTKLIVDYRQWLSVSSAQLVGRTQSFS